MLPEPCVLQRDGGILPAALIQEAISLLDLGPDSPVNSIGDGPYCEMAAGISIYVHWGPVGVHNDDAGITYGYVLKGREADTGPFELCVSGDDTRCSPMSPIGNLDTDSAFVINSNNDHEVNTDDGDLLIFIVQDFDNDWSEKRLGPNTPPLTLDQWLDKLPAHLAAWISHVQNLTKTRTLSTLSNTTTQEGEDHD